MDPLHVLNVGPSGTFRKSGQFHSTPEDVNAMIAHLEQKQLDHVGESDSPRDLLEIVLANLESLLPGSPDVAALRVAQARRHELPVPHDPIRRVPMLYRGAAELIRAAADHPDILPDDSLLNMVSTRLFMDSAYPGGR